MLECRHAERIGPFEGSPALIIDIRDHPKRFPVVQGRYRRARVDPFRYAVVYCEEPDGAIFVAAYFHLMRNPARLRRRLK
jgi:hypothetical protein